MILRGNKHLTACIRSTSCLTSAFDKARNWHESVRHRWLWRYSETLQWQCLQICSVYEYCRKQPALVSSGRTKTTSHKRMCVPIGQRVQCGHVMCWRVFFNNRKGKNYTGQNIQRLPSSMKLTQRKERVLFLWQKNKAEAHVQGLWGMLNLALQNPEEIINIRACAWNSIMFVLQNLTVYQNSHKY